MIENDQTKISNTHYAISSAKAKTLSQQQFFFHSLALMTTGVGAVADVVGVNEGWTLLAALKGVRGGDELEKLFP